MQLKNSKIYQFLQANIELIKNFLFALISFTLLVGTWEVFAYFNFYWTNIFPPPSKFLVNLFHGDLKVGLGSQASTIPESIFASIYRVIVGLIIGFSGALVIGFLISSSIWVKRFLMPIIRLLAPIAPIAWIPLALVLFGIGNSTAIFIVFMGVFFMLTIATIKAIGTVPANLINAAKTLGANKNQIWMKVILPFIIPNVFTILRLNFIAAWMAVLAAEMTGLRDGLGAVIMMGRNLFNNEMILQGMLFIGITGFLFDIALKTIQDKVFWWDNK